MMEKLYLGVAREIITPEIGSQMYGYRPDIFSESVADDLTVTAFYFRQGDVQALMLSITVCLIQTELAGQITARIEKEFGIPREACMLSATHTHSSPNTAGQTGWGDIDNTYCDGIFIPGILKAVERAMADPVYSREGITVQFIVHGEKIPRQVNACCFSMDLYCLFSLLLPLCFGCFLLHFFFFFLPWESYFKSYRICWKANFTHTMNLYLHIIISKKYWGYMEQKVQ